MTEESSIARKYINIKIHKKINNINIINQKLKTEYKIFKIKKIIYT